MSSPSTPTVRNPAVAGTFYPLDAAACRQQAKAFLRPASIARSADQPLLGGIVPHAGWICSGAIAGQAIATLAKSSQPDVVVVFGAIHTPVRVDYAALDTHATWVVPGGQSPVHEQLQRQLAEQSGTFAFDERLHRFEHAVEVELPILQLAFPDAAILPVEVPVSGRAVEVGRQTAQRIQQSNLRAIYLASSDLTHYGPNYGFYPAGIGLPGIQWANDNDRRLLDLVRKLAAEAIVPEVRAHYNACGGGAIAAMLAACLEHGATQATILRHTNSYETLADVQPQLPDNAVGYAGVVVG
mgnify:CR=1 FL=1